MEFSDQLSIEIAGEELILDATGAIYWPKGKCLFLADLHLGKANHFRKEGIAIPIEIQKVNFNKLQTALRKYSPAEVYFLGDLFHSTKNKTWDEFATLIKPFKSIQFHLVEGNHDILDISEYLNINIQVHPEGLILDPFTLYHHPTLDANHYSLAGHLHPGIRLKGKGRQHLRFSCFYFTPDLGVLPAFGAFTGKYICTPKKEDQIIGVSKKGLFEL